MIKDENIFGSNSPHKKIVDMKPVYAEDGQNVYTPLDGIRLITKEDGENFTLGVKIGEFEIPSMPVKIDSAYNEKHFVKSFALPEEFPIGSEIPLVLIGSSWHATNIDETQEITKFCWGEYEGISPDFTEAGFNKMPHYILF